jgi:hypothetical protein
MMGNITVYNRQDDCQDMLQCFGLELYSELNDFLEAQRFSGPSQKVYVLFFYKPPPPPRCVQVALLCCCAACAAVPLCRCAAVLLCSCAAVLLYYSCATSATTNWAWLSIR